MTAAGERRPTRPPQPGVRLTRRGRVALVLVVAGALLAAFWFGTWRASLAAAEGAGPGAAYETVVLREGQTLWGVASRQAPDADPRLMVRRIIELNHLSGAAVQVGQRIRVPATR